LGLRPEDPDHGPTVLAGWRLFEGAEGELVGGRGESAADAARLVAHDPRARRAQAARLLRFLQGVPATPSQVEALVPALDDPGAFREALRLVGEAAQVDVPGHRFRSRAG
jgi:hypothetical protein